MMSGPLERMKSFLLMNDLGFPKVLVASRQVQMCFAVSVKTLSHLLSSGVMANITIIPTILLRWKSHAIISITIIN